MYLKVHVQENILSKSLLHANVKIIYYNALNGVFQGHIIRTGRCNHNPHIQSVTSNEINLNNSQNDIICDNYMIAASRYI